MMKENLKELSGKSFYEAVGDLTTELYEKYGDLRDPACETEVLSIARGGLVPATYVVYRLGCPINIMYLRSYPKPGMQKQVEAYSILPFRSRKLPKRIIVVDDIQDTGQSFDFLRSFFRENFNVTDDSRVEIVYAVVIWRQREGVAAPDFYGCKTASKDWVIFPYDHQLD